jgi:hypothetical protein
MTTWGSLLVEEAQQSLRLSQSLTFKIFQIFQSLKRQPVQSVDANLRVFKSIKKLRPLRIQTFNNCKFLKHISKKNIIKLLQRRGLPPL